jgi:hypothetical protein
VESCDHSWEAIAGPFLEHGTKWANIYLRCRDCGTMSETWFTQGMRPWSRKTVDIYLRGIGIRWAQWETAKP